LLSNQTFFDTIPECQRRPESNGYRCKPFARGLVNVQISVNGSTARAMPDKKRYGYYNKQYHVEWRTLGSTPDSPYVFNLWNGALMSQRFWSPMPVNGSGNRLAMSPLTTTGIRSGSFGDWVVIALPYPRGTKFKISVPREENVFVKMANSLDEMTPYAPYYDSNQQHLYIHMTNDFRGTFNNGTVRGYSRDYPYVGFSTYNVYAQCPKDDCTVPGSYSIPPMPKTLPKVLRHTTFTANLVPVQSSMKTHKGTFFGQLYPNSFYKMPVMSLQLWHSVFGDQNDLYMSLVDKNNKLLSDNVVGHSTFTGNLRVNHDLWKAMVEKRVFVSVRRIRNNEEVLRGQLIVDSNQEVLTPPVLLNTTMSCATPTYAHSYIYEDSFSSKNFTVRGPAFNQTYHEPFCGKSSLYMSSSNRFYIPLKNAPRCDVNMVIDSKYKSVEFYVKTTIPWKNYNYVNMSVEGLVLLPNKTVVTNVFWLESSAMSNYVINRHGWTFVRVNLNKIGGNTLSCLQFNIHPWQSGMPVIMDNLRFSAIDDKTSFYGVNSNIKTKLRM